MRSKIYSKSGVVSFTSWDVYDCNLTNIWRIYWRRLIVIPHAVLLATIIPGISGVLFYIISFASERSSFLKKGQKYFHKHLRWVSGVVATAIASFSLFLILTMSTELMGAQNNGQGSLTFVYPWIDSMNIDLVFSIDLINFPIGVIIAFISTLSCLYSIKYMEKEPKQPSFYGNLLLFMTGMIGVVFSINLIQFYLFWGVMLVPMLTALEP